MFVQFAGKKMANTCWESETACQVHRELFRIDFFFFFFIMTIKHQIVQIFALKFYFKNKNILIKGHLI